MQSKFSFHTRQLYLMSICWSRPLPFEHQCYCYCYHIISYQRYHRYCYHILLITIFSILFLFLSYFLAKHIFPIIVISITLLCQIYFPHYRYFYHILLPTTFSIFKIMQNRYIIICSIITSSRYYYYHHHHFLH